MTATIRREIWTGLLIGGLAGLAALRLTALPARFDGVWMAAGVLAPPAVWWVLRERSRWLVLFFLAALLLPPVALPWGDSGAHPAILVAALGLWAGAVRLRMWHLAWGAAPAALLLLFFAILLSVPLAAYYSGAEIAMGSLTRTALFGISVYLFFYLSSGPARDFAPRRLVRLFFWAGALSAAFAALDFYFQFPAPARFAPQFVWLTSGVFRRAQGVFYEASTLGMFCGFMAVMVAVIAVLRMGGQVGIRAVWLFPGGLLFLAVQVMSFSRASLAALAVSLGALGWMERNRLPGAARLGRWAAASIAFLGIGAAILYKLFPDLMLAYLQRLWNSGEYMFSEPNMILSRRLDSWSFLLDYLGRHPFQSIFGIGYKTLPYSDVLGQAVVADNMYLSLLIETGWFGLLALLLFHGAVLATSYRAARDAGNDVNRMFALWIFCFWCGVTVQMASGDLLTYWRILPCFLAVLAIAIRHAESPQ